MKHKPITLTIISMCLGAIALSIPIQIMMIYEHGPSEILAVIDKITVLNWLVMSLSALSAICIARASPLVRYAVPTLIAVVAFNNWVVGKVGTDYSELATALATAGFISLHFPLIRSEMRRLLSNPELRWWLHAERKLINVPVFVGAPRDKVLRTETFDLSESGAFIPCPTSQPTGQGLDPDSRINVSMSLGMHFQIRCDGRIVRRTEARGMYPAGIGIQFVDLTNKQRRDLRKFISRRASQADAQI